MKRLIITLSVMGVIALGVYAAAFVNAIDAINAASQVMDEPQLIIEPATEEAQATPQAAPATETVNVPVAIPKAVTTPQVKPTEAAQPTPAAKPKCDVSYIDNMQREIDDIAALIEAKPNFAYETENGQRLQTLTFTLNEYKKACE